MAKRKHYDSLNDLQEPDTAAADRCETMPPSATGSSSALENDTSTPVAASQMPELSQLSGAADTAQQPQAIMINQTHSGPVKRRNVFDHNAALLSVLNAEISFVKSKVATLEAQNATIKAENAELEARNDNFESENIDLKALNNSLKNRNTYLEGQKNKLKEQNTKLQTQYDRLADDYHNIDEVKNGGKSLDDNVEVQRDKLKAQNTKLHDKYAKLEAEYSGLEGAQHKLRTQISSMKKHINKLQDEAFFEHDDHGDYTRAILNKMQKFVYEVKLGLSSYRIRDGGLPDHLLDTYENAIELNDFLSKTLGPRPSPRRTRRSGTDVLSADTDLSDSSSGSEYPGDSAETSDDEDADGSGDAGDSDDTIDSDSGSDSGGSNMESSLDKPPVKKRKRNNDWR